MALGVVHVVAPGPVAPPSPDLAILPLGPGGSTHVELLVLLVVVAALLAFFALGRSKGHQQSRLQEVEELLHLKSAAVATQPSTAQLAQPVAGTAPTPTAAVAQPSTPVAKHARDLQGVSGPVDLGTFANSLKPKVAAGATGPVTLVSGNQASDADSIVTAVVYGYLKQMQSPGETVVPVVMCNREDVVLRNETTKLLGQCGVDHKDLVYLDDAGIEAVLDRVNKVTLVDHNKATGKLDRLKEFVVEIKDHHKDLEAHNGAAGDNRTIAFQGSAATAASACSVILEEFIKTPFGKELLGMNKGAAARALLGVILLDSENLAKGKACDRDTAAVKECEAVLSKNPTPPPSRDDFWKDLDDSKFDNHFWNGLNIDQCMRYDFKEFTTPAGQKYGLSSCLCSLETLSEKQNWGKALTDNAAKYDLFGVLTQVHPGGDGQKSRQLLLYSSDEEVASNAAEFARTYETSLLKLKAIAGVRGPPGIQAFLQENLHASRKQVQPCLGSFFATQAAVQEEIVCHCGTAMKFRHPDANWYCDGVWRLGGCKLNQRRAPPNAYGSYDEIEHFSCEKCDIDFCKRCATDIKGSDGGVRELVNAGLFSDHKKVVADGLDMKGDYGSKALSEIAVHLVGFNSGIGARQTWKVESGPVEVHESLRNWVTKGTKHETGEFIEADSVEHKDGDIFIQRVRGGWVKASDKGTHSCRPTEGHDSTVNCPVLEYFDEEKVEGVVKGIPLSYGVLVWHGEDCVVGQDGEVQLGVSKFVCEFLRQHPDRKALAFVARDQLDRFRQSWEAMGHIYRDRICVRAVDPGHEAVDGVGGWFEGTQGLAAEDLKALQVGKIALDCTQAKHVVALGGEGYLQHLAQASLREGTSWRVYAVARGEAVQRDGKTQRQTSQRPRERQPTLADWAAAQRAAGESPNLELVCGGLNGFVNCADAFAGEALTATCPSCEAPLINEGVQGEVGDEWGCDGKDCKQKPDDLIRHRRWGCERCTPEHHFEAAAPFGYHICASCNFKQSTQYLPPLKTLTPEEWSSQRCNDGQPVKVGLLRGSDADHSSCYNREALEKLAALGCNTVAWNGTWTSADKLRLNGEGHPSYNPGNYFNIIPKFVRGGPQRRAVAFVRSWGVADQERLKAVRIDCQDRMDVVLLTGALDCIDVLMQSQLLTHVIAIGGGKAVADDARRTIATIPWTVYAPALDEGKPKEEGVADWAVKERPEVLVAGAEENFQDAFKEDVPLEIPCADENHGTLKDMGHETTDWICSGCDHFCQSGVTRHHQTSGLRRFGNDTYKDYSLCHACAWKKHIDKAARRGPSAPEIQPPSSGCPLVICCAPAQADTAEQLIKELVELFQDDMATEKGAGDSLPAGGNLKDDKILAIRLSMESDNHLQVRTVKEKTRGHVAYQNARFIHLAPAAPKVPQESRLQAVEEFLHLKPEVHKANNKAARWEEDVRGFDLVLFPGDSGEMLRRLTKRVHDWHPHLAAHGPEQVMEL